MKTALLFVLLRACAIVFAVLLLGLSGCQRKLCVCDGIVVGMNCRCIPTAAVARTICIESTGARDIACVTDLVFPDGGAL